MDQSIDVDALAAEALALKAAIDGGDKTAAERRLADDLERAAAKGFSFESLLPEDEAPGLGMAGRNRDPNGFFQALMAAIHKRVCAENGEFREMMRRGTDTSVTAVLMTLIDYFDIPRSYMFLLVPVAVLICDSGIAAFCEVTRPE